jgi:hypothetical protein
MSDIFAGLPRYFEGADDSTPPGCTLLATKVFDIATTYVLRDGQVIGRVEHGNVQSGYVGSALKGGRFVGVGYFSALAQKIADATA